MDEEEVLTVEQAYQILELAPDADAQQIRAAYRSLARRFHPDVNSEPDAEQRMKRLNAAFALLSKRATGVAEDPPAWNDERISVVYRGPWRPGYAGYAVYSVETGEDLRPRSWPWRLLVPVLLLAVFLISAPFIISRLHIHRASSARAPLISPAAGTTVIPSSSQLPLHTLISFTPGSMFTLAGPDLGRLRLRDSQLHVVPPGMAIAGQPDIPLLASWMPVAWSPDGHKVALTLAPAATPNRPQIVEIVAMPGGQVLASYQAQAAVWAPDSQHIALVVAQNPAQPLAQTSYHLAIGDVTDPSSFLDLSLLPVGSLPVWTPDGQALIFAYKEQTQLWEYPIAGQPQFLLSEPLGEKIQPLFWLDDSTLLCMERNGQQYTLTLLTPATRVEQPLPVQDGVLPRPVMANGGQDLIYRFAASYGQPVQLMDYSRMKSTAVTLVPGGYAPDALSLSSDGALLAFAANGSAQSRALCLLPTTAASATPVCMIPSTGALRAPVWSPAQPQMLYVLTNPTGTALHLLTVVAG
jgi:hypothetical protein